MQLEPPTLCRLHYRFPVRMLDGVTPPLLFSRLVADTDIGSVLNKRWPLVNQLTVCHIGSLAVLHVRTVRFVTRRCQYPMYCMRQYTARHDHNIRTPKAGARASKL